MVATKFGKTNSVELKRSLNDTLEKEIAKLIDKFEATVKRVILKSNKIHHIRFRKSSHYEIL